MRLTPGTKVVACVLSTTVFVSFVRPIMICMELSNILIILPIGILRVVKFTVMRRSGIESRAANGKI
jgi:hypothetical protein